jgi:hypothetical protein
VLAALAGGLGRSLGGAVIPPPAGGVCDTVLGGLDGEEELVGGSPGFCSPPGLQALKANGNEIAAIIKDTWVKRGCFMMVRPLCGIKLKDEDGLSAALAAFNPHAMLISINPKS